MEEEWSGLAIDCLVRCVGRVLSPSVEAERRRMTPLGEEVAASTAET